MRTFRLVSAVLAALASLVLPLRSARAHADDADAARIAGAGHSLEWKHATVHVAAFATSATGDDAVMVASTA